MNTIDIDKIQALSLKMASDIVLFVRDDLVQQKTCPIYCDNFTITSVLSRKIPDISQKIQNYLLEDNLPISVKEEAIKSVISLYKGDGGLVGALLDQDDEIKKEMLMRKRVDLHPDQVQKIAFKSCLFILIESGKFSNKMEIKFTDGEKESENIDNEKLPEEKFPQDKEEVKPTVAHKMKVGI